MYIHRTILARLVRPIFTFKPSRIANQLRAMSISPPHKKLRTETDRDVEMIPASDAPVNTLFVPATEAVASTSKPQPKQGKKKNRKPRRNLPEAYSPADVTFRDVRDFLGEEYVDGVLAKGDESEWHAPEGLELWSMIELEVGAFTVSGMLCLISNHLRMYQ